MSNRDELLVSCYHESAHGVIGADLGYAVERLTVEGGTVAHAKHLKRPEDAPTIAALGTGSHFFDLDPAALSYAVRQMVIDFAGPVATRVAERRTGRVPSRPTPPPAKEWEPRIMPNGRPEPNPVDEMLGRALPVNDEPMAQERAYHNAGLTGHYLAEWAHAEAGVRVRARWPVIGAVADALVRHTTLDAADFAAVYTPPGGAHGAE